MSFSFSNRKFLRWSYLIALILLSILLALLWQQVRSPRFSVRTTTTREVAAESQVQEPIQPIPLKIALNSSAKVALGKKLFQDVRLSSNNQVSCMSCHHLNAGGADSVAQSVGVNGVVGEINSPTIFNVQFNFRFNWDGEFESLADHLTALLPNPQTMASSWDVLVQKLQQIPDYAQTFAKIYPEELTQATLTDAIVSYESSLFTPNSRFDKFLRGDSNALTADEQEGYQLFKAYGCVSCHQGMNVGGNMFQRFGVIGDYFADRGNITSADLGRFNVTQNPDDRHVFRVPSLRNVALTAPYFHDGSAETLEEAIAIMAKYQLGRPLAKEQSDRIAQFLRTLTGEYQGKPLERSSQ